MPILSADNRASQKKAFGGHWEGEGVEPLAAGRSRGSVAVRLEAPRSVAEDADTVRASTPVAALGKRVRMEAVTEGRESDSAASRAPRKGSGRTVSVRPRRLLGEGGSALPTSAGAGPGPRPSRTTGGSPARGSGSDRPSRRRTKADPGSRYTPRKWPSHPG